MHCLYVFIFYFVNIQGGGALFKTPHDTIRTSIMRNFIFIYFYNPRGEGTWSSCYHRLSWPPWIHTDFNVKLLLIELHSSHYFIYCKNPWAPTENFLFIFYLPLFHIRKGGALDDSKKFRSILFNYHYLNFQIWNKNTYNQGRSVKRSSKRSRKRNCPSWIMKLKKY